MATISQGVRDLMFTKAREIENRDEYWKFVNDYCDNNGLDYWQVWQGCARSFFYMQEERRMRQRCIEAVNNTFAYFPSRDLARMEHWRDEDIEKKIEIEDCGGTWVVKKIFGIEVDVHNRECRCFALRWREADKRADGTPIEWKTLLTTFDFTTINKGEKEENMVWSCGYSAGSFYDRKYIPSVLYFSLEEFIETYKAFADERYDADKLIMVDDTPEPINYDYDDDSE